MKSITQLNLKENEKKALQELKKKLSESLPEVEIILYGSKARDNSEAFLTLMFWCFWIER